MKSFYWIFLLMLWFRLFHGEETKNCSFKMAIFLFSLILNVKLLIPFAGASLFAANETDHIALLAIKSKILEDPQGITSSWNDSFHYCQWQGVTCGHRHKRVTILNLSGRSLVGSLSPYIGNLSFLSEVQLQNNTLGGVIPQEVGRLFRLEFLFLHNNSFEGEIPSNISQCAKLTSLGLNYNKLVGIIPKEFGSLFMLKEIYIRYNNLSGEIPPFFGNLTSLELIDLPYCHFTGSIPNVFHKLKSLKFLLLGFNHLIGTIPSSIYNLSSLEILAGTSNQFKGSLLTSFPLKLRGLYLGGNHFTGSLFPSLSNCSNLEVVDFDSNDLSGMVSINFGNFRNLSVVYLGANNFVSGERDEVIFLDSFSNCSNLRELDISKNRFGGMLPNSLGNFSTQLERLWLGSNSFYGKIPSSISNLFKLTSLILEENQFTGTIPLAIGKLEKLRKLSLFSNNLSGKIPNSIGNLSFLYFLVMSNNKLEGTIPPSLGNCGNLQYLSLYQNNLSGSIPKQIFELSLLSIILNLDRNHLSGPLPIEIGNLKNLGILGLAENHFSGELPSSLGSCTSLELLDLSSNSFQGSIPTSLASLRALQGLYLSHNNFSGSIPRFFEENSLEILDISFNKFEGEVPVLGVFVNSSNIVVEGNPRLCGGLPELQLPKCNLKHLKHSKKGHKKLSDPLKIVIPIASSLVGIAILSFFLFCWCTKKRRDQPLGLEMKEPLLKVSFEQLLKATNGFSSENLIGVGAFASVYKGVLDNDNGIVAVKVLNLQHRGGFKSFITECEALRQIRHRNLVKVITSCSSIDFQGNDFKALVYEYMSNGTLDQWLHSRLMTTNKLPKLTLIQRICIAIDVACAIDYLHHHSGNPVIHCDLKPSNILLDGDMVAHVGDFGLAMFLLPELSTANPSSSARIRGTIGYAPPEYGLGNDVSKYGDVYSYGIILLEMVTGRKPTDPFFQDGLNLHTWVSMALVKGEMAIVEPILLDDRNKECLISMLKLGVTCSLDSPRDRMDISRAIHELHLIKEIILAI